MGFGNCIESLWTPSFLHLGRFCVYYFIYLYVIYCFHFIFLIFQKYFFKLQSCSLHFDYTKDHFKKKNMAQILSLIVPYVIPAFSTGNTYFQSIISRWLLFVIFLKMLFHTEKISYWNIQYIYWMNLMWVFCVNKSW